MYQYFPSICLDTFPSDCVVGVVVWNTDNKANSVQLQLQLPTLAEFDTIKELL